LIVRENSCDYYYGSENYSKIEVIVWRFLNCRGLDRVGEEAKDSAEPQEQREPPEQVLTELDPLGGLRGRVNLLSPSL